MSAPTVPAAAELPPGWSLRLSIAGADAPSFEHVPAAGAQRIQFAGAGCRLRLPTDAELNQIGVLNRRLIEARIVAPLLSAMAAEFGAERVHQIARGVIVAIARQQGNELAEHSGGRSLPVLHGTLDRWTANDALTLDVHEVSESALSFDVTRRCRYVEMYRERGIPELGAILSCNRHGALIEGFNPDVTLERTQSLMGGAGHCDFRYSRGNV